MFSKIWAVIEILRGLLDLWKEWQNARRDEQAAEALKKRGERAKAIKDLEKAKTDEEIFDAQKRLTANKS